MTSHDQTTLAAFEKLHKKRLLTYAAKTAHGHIEDAEEGYNDALNSLWPDIVAHFNGTPEDERADPKKAVPSILWLRIKGRVYDRRNSALRHEKHMTDLPDDPESHIAEMVDHDCLPEVADLVLSRLAEIIKAGLPKQDTTRRRVLHLLVFRDPPLKHEEAAIELGVSNDIIKAELCRALQHLKTHLARIAHDKGCWCVLSKQEHELLNRHLLKQPHDKVKNIVADLQLTVSEVKQRIEAGMIKLYRCLTRKLIDGHDSRF